MKLRNLAAMATMFALTDESRKLDMPTYNGRVSTNKPKKSDSRDKVVKARRKKGKIAKQSRKNNR